MTFTQHQSVDESWADHLIAPCLLGFTSDNCSLTEMFVQLARANWGHRGKTIRPLALSVKKWRHYTTL